jgi:hypothetical protein
MHPCWNPSLADHDEDGDAVMDGCDNCPAVVVVDPFAA